MAFAMPAHANLVPTKRVEPQYPTSMIPVRATAVVSVRCIIDRHGRIIDPEVVQMHSSAYRAPGDVPAGTVT